MSFVEASASVKLVDYALSMNLGVVSCGFKVLFQKKMSDFFFFLLQMNTCTCITKWENTNKFVKEIKFM